MTEEETAAGSKGERRRQKFDIDAQWTRHVALRIAYLGWNYDGFAAQDSTQNTVEAHLFAALRRACLVRTDASARPKDAYAYSRCGRTDAGVSAFAQVVAARLRTKLRRGRGVLPPPGRENPAPDAAPDDAAEIDYVAAVNGGLPADIRVLGWAPVAADFDARFSCRWRAYRYYLPRGAAPDVGAVRAAAAAFVGTHDFRNFCRADLVNVASFVRTVYEADVSEEDGGDMLCVRVRGSGFLWHQVRCMVAVLARVGCGAEDSGVVARLLDVAACPGKPAYRPADERPLVLYDCGYEPPLAFRAAAHALDAAHGALAAVHADAAVRMRMLGAMLGDMARFAAVLLPPPRGAQAEARTLPLADARVVLAAQRAEHERGKRRRSLAEEGAAAQSLEQRVEALGPAKRRKYEERMELRRRHAASATTAATDADDDGGE